MKFQYYQSSKNDEWYWRLRASNGKIIADGGEGYKKKAECIERIQDIREGAGSASVEEVDG